MVKCNQGALSGAIQNLINNALDASESGMSVNIHIASNEHQISVMVTDTGCGMTEEVKATALQPFVTHKTHGTGLGLAVVDSVAKSHHGKVTIVSAPGKGSCVSISLPKMVEEAS